MSGAWFKFNLYNKSTFCHMMKECEFLQCQKPDYNRKLLLVNKLKELSRTWSINWMLNTKLLNVKCFFFPQSSKLLLSIEGSSPPCKMLLWANKWFIFFQNDHPCIVVRSTTAAIESPVQSRRRPELNTTPLSWGLPRLRGFGKWALLLNR